jgi:excinuclease UvrABC nuclease subunit
MSRWYKEISYCFNRFWQYNPNTSDSLQVLLPNKPGVYAIYDGTQLVYIGSTSSLRNRFGMHKKLMNGLNFAHIKVSFSSSYGDWTKRELRLIKRLNPELNKHSTRVRDFL